MGDAEAGFDQGTMGPERSVADFMEWRFPNRPRRQIRVDSALRARVQAMVTFAIASWGFLVTVSRAVASRGGRGDYGRAIS